METVKKTKANATFIMISGVYCNEIVFQAYAKGIEFYIKKPINFVELTSSITRIIEKHGFDSF